MKNGKYRKKSLTFIRDSQLMMFSAGPLVGNLVDCFPRIPAYNLLSLIQVRSHSPSLMDCHYLFHTHNSWIWALPIL